MEVIRFRMSDKKKMLRADLYYHLVDHEVHSLLGTYSIIVKEHL